MSLCKCNAACYTQVQHVTAVFRDCQLQLNKLFKYIADLKQWLSLTCGSWVCLPAPTAMCVCVCVSVCAPAAPWLLAHSLQTSAPTLQFPAQPGPPQMIKDLVVEHTPPRGLDRASGTHPVLCLQQPEAEF